MLAGTPRRRGRALVLGALLLAAACGRTNQNTDETRPEPAEPPAPGSCSNPQALVEFEDLDLELAVRGLLKVPSGPLTVAKLQELPSRTSARSLGFGSCSSSLSTKTRSRI